MQPRAHSPEFSQEVVASQMQKVAMASRRAVGDKDVGSIRDRAVPDVIGPRVLEGPVALSRGERAPVDPEATPICARHVDVLVFEMDDSFPSKRGSKRLW
ncbi:hypothetical protein VD0002_g7253 [Verticillium dahliae]|uniref:Uncharacterized protein n=1 Tax=Verticillium dahliae TaxID=27337 RepID=A0A2J8FLZ2_VERDA|nr:hypothetical protein BJF96_g4770 [Verticillium dahliae]PNH43536.1 hypothetical protein VD0004_g3985 [Verticillium dahliae]PNH48817.1 hypothetical protein VD0003_g8320 [Verticillium dahliae]PNH60382.1 hypothetical protein VD0002_g7253 [Verticillium dahliae]PNH74779.1 hypothetical protein VD0001_g2817 [Verticillium dahliae]